jgi:hypothetical protein
MVEFFIFLLHKYYENLDVAKEQVFANVHFTLFYTAILNAFQSVILAIVTTRLSQTIWVETEALELNHYVEIREEFERISAQLRSLKHNAGNKPHDGSSTTSSDNHEQEVKQPGDNPKRNHRWFQRSKGSTVGDEFIFEFNMNGVRKLFVRIVDHIRYPRLKRKHDKLLLQVRFHELRVHFLQAYKLPLRLRVSDYLIRSENQVLIKLVHVSTLAWLLLTAAMNLLYVCMGLVAYETEDSEIVGTTMIWIFFWCLVVFLLASVLVYNKMKSIFKTIMHKKTLWDIRSDGEIKEQLADEQLALFWGGDPKYVIAAIQFMQFGFAIALSVILIFWELIDDGGVPMEFYLIAIFLCYMLFVYVMAQVIPRYTLCTSLGQLVNQKRLNETLALFHLEEAKRQRLEVIELEGYNFVDEMDLGLSNRTVTPAPDARLPAIEGVLQFGKTAKEGIKTLLSSVKIKTPTTNVKASIGKETVDSAALMAQLVKLDTDSLRTNLPLSEQEELSKRETERAKRRNRRKTVSDGVAAMASMGGMNRKKSGSGGVAEMAAIGESFRKKSGSGGVAEMAAMSGMSSAATDILDSSGTGPRQTVDDAVVPGQKSRGFDARSGNFLPHVGVVPVDASLPRDAGAERAARRHRRKKSASDGVAMMAWTHSQCFDESDHIPSSIPEEEKVEEAIDSSLTATSLGSTEIVPLSNVATLLQTGSGDTSGEATAMSLERIEEGHQDAKPIEADEVSTSSVGSIDGHSDVDDVPEVDSSFIQKPEVVYMPHPSLRERFRAYYTSKRFPVISRIFGTMVAFFFVGQRIERFLHTEGIISNDFISFDFSSTISFWVLTTWMSLFVNTSFTIFYSLQPWNGLDTQREQAAVAAAVMDTLLTSVCLSVFFVAEVQRCCYPDESSSYGDTSERSLAGDDFKTDDEYASYPDPAPCNCPEFGSRLYGGLGTIEPYVTLICLRVFRHWVAGHLVEYMNRKRIWSSTNNLTALSLHQNASIGLDPFDVFGDSHNGLGAHMKEEVGTISELWEMAIGRFPNIVAKHGEFSGELLQAMLGLVVAESSFKHENGADTPASVPGGDNGEGSIKVGRDSPERSFIPDQQYSDLAPATQEIIMAGRLGKKVMSVRHLPSLDPDATELRHSTDALGSLRFQLDKSEPLSTSTESMFNAPNARLVRSMRRCDRKLLPILDAWSVVDVVMTRFEVVYFEVTVADDVTDNGNAENTKQALIATKGGKGLRLCDVAVGRRVVGHMSLSDVTSAYVEREMPGNKGEDDGGLNDTHMHTEFWQPGRYRGSHSSSSWNAIVEDRVKIQTAHGGTLYLRFYADLEDAQSSSRALSGGDNEKESITKDNAFQWIQTIVRYCGPEQLKQALPHFGGDTEDELRDYLILSHDNDSKHGHRRGFSSGDHRLPMRHLPRRLSQIGLLSRPVFSRSTSSGGDAVSSPDEETGTRGILGQSHPRLHRSSSTGETSTGRTDLPYEKRRAYHDADSKTRVSFSDDVAALGETLKQKDSAGEQPFPEIEATPGDEVLNDIVEGEVFVGKEE